MTPRIFSMKIHQGTKFGTLEKTICDHFSCFNGIIKQNVRARLPVSNIPNSSRPSIHCPLFVGEKNYRPWLLLEKKTVLGQRVEGG